MSLAFADDRLHFSTGTASDGRARIYAIDVSDRDALILWARLEPALAPTLVRGPKGALFTGTAPNGRVYRVGPGRVKAATYLSIEQDLARTARVGRVWFDADRPAGAKVAVSIRSGNTRRPDDTWSTWSAPISDPDGGAVKVPNARYVQLRAVLTAGKGGSPRVKSMHASVVRHNSAPQIREVFPLRRGVYLSALPIEVSSDKTVTLNARAMSDLRKPAKRSRGQRVRQRTKPGMMTVVWRVRDGDGDDLLYRVEMRKYGPPKSAWQAIDADLTNAGFFSFDSRAYPDGWYQFRVTATDRPSNAPEETKSDRHLSDPILIDNLAPSLSNAIVSNLKGNRLKVEVTATDKHSRLDSAEVSVNGGPWLMLPAADGLIDAKQEELSVVLGPNEWQAYPGVPTAVRIRVTDEADNETSGSATARRR